MAILQSSHKINDIIWFKKNKNIKKWYYNDNFMRFVDITLARIRLFCIFALTI